MAKSVSQDAQDRTKKAQLIAQHRELMNSWNNAQDVFTRLCRRLHSSLELDQCLAVFLEELRSIMAFNSFCYQHDQDHDSYVYTEGYGGQHNCQYNLALQGQSLGYLTINRRTRFAEEELAVLEQMIGILVFPLRNCWQHRQAWDAALTDSLTHLGNKRALLDALERSSTLSCRHGEPHALLLCDLDHFKQVNDCHGHVFGDRVLCEIAHVIRCAIRSSDVAYRYGGEEFAVLLPHTNADDAMIVAERIRVAVEQHAIRHGELVVNVTTSSGVAEYHQQYASTANEFIAQADAALYQAKRDGRNRTCKAIFSQPALARSPVTS